MFCVLQYVIIGVQIHLHKHDDVPEVVDLGFAVSPGTHTLVGIQLSEVLKRTRYIFSCIPAEY